MIGGGAEGAGSDAAPTLDSVDAGAEPDDEEADDTEEAAADDHDDDDDDDTQDRLDEGDDEQVEDALHASSSLRWLSCCRRWR